MKVHQNHQPALGFNQETPYNPPSPPTIYYLQGVPPDKQFGNKRVAYPESLTPECNPSHVIIVRMSKRVVVGVICGDSVANSSTIGT
jgi:hypothetical protein